MALVASSVGIGNDLFHHRSSHESVTLTPPAQDVDTPNGAQIQILKPSMYGPQ